MKFTRIPTIIALMILAVSGLTACSNIQPAADTATSTHGYGGEGGHGGVGGGAGAGGGR